MFMIILRKLKEMLCRKKNKAKKKPPKNPQKTRKQINKQILKKYLFIKNILNAFNIPGYIACAIV